MFKTGDSWYSFQNKGKLYALHVCVCMDKNNIDRRVAKNKNPNTHCANNNTTNNSKSNEFSLYTMVCLHEMCRVCALVTIVFSTYSRMCALRVYCVCFFFWCTICFTANMHVNKLIYQMASQQQQQQKRKKKKPKCTATRTLNHFTDLENWLRFFQQTNITHNENLDRKLTA